MDDVINQTIAACKTQIQLQDALIAKHALVVQDLMVKEDNNQTEAHPVYWAYPNMTTMYSQQEQQKIYDVFRFKVGFAYHKKPGAALTTGNKESS